MIVRLCDVAPDGSSLRVSYGVLNLTHRDGHAEPAPLVPGETFTVDVQLNDIAHAFPAGPPYPRRGLDHLLADRLAE